MKILSASQIKLLDAYTIQNEPISSINLMERAAMACVKRLVKLTQPETCIRVFCGKGNNGGDGLAVTRLLLDLGYDCEALVINYTEKFSEDCSANFQKLNEKYPSNLKTINSSKELQNLNYSSDTLIIDALLGTGINKVPDGLLANVIEFLNTHFTTIVSIDIPSGLYCDVCSSDNNQIVRSALTLTFQLPKLSFLMAENKAFVNEFELLDIGLSNNGLSQLQSNNYYISKELIISLLKPRIKFSHKGNYGHCLLLAGSRGKSGAAIISAMAALRSGAGLLTVQSNNDTLQALLHHLPEAMSIADIHPDYISGIDKPENYEAIGFGPGVGQEEETAQTLKKTLHYYRGKLVIDADGLNILSENKTWLEFLPPSTILTPHPKEFERLCGKHTNEFERLETLRQFSVKRKCVVILKGAHSAIAMPDGNIFFNSSGNAGLAKAGSGDTLTGIILGLLSRGYNAPQAAIIGTYIHGYAADLCIKRKSMESLLASDVIKCLPKAFKKLEDAKEKSF